jgi:hypothetical protein
VLQQGLGGLYDQFPSAAPRIDLGWFNRVIKQKESSRRIGLDPGLQDAVAVEPAAVAEVDPLLFWSFPAEKAFFVKLTDSNPCRHYT